MQNKTSPGLKLMLLPLMLSLVACANKPAAWQAEPVSAPAIPVLPKEARQQASLPWCSPTCSAGLMLERESWLQHMTELELQD